MRLRYFRQAASIDLADTHVAIDGGVQIAAQGGVWLATAWQSNRNCRREWASLGFSIQWRDRLLSIKIDQIHRCLEASLKKGEPMTLVVCGTSHQLRRNQVLRVSAASPPPPIARSRPISSCSLRRRSIRSSTGLSIFGRRSPPNFERHGFAVIYDETTVGSDDNPGGVVLNHQSLQKSQFCGRFVVATRDCQH